MLRYMYTAYLVVTEIEGLLRRTDWIFDYNSDYIQSLKGHYCSYLIFSKTYSCVQMLQQANAIL